MKVRAVDGYRSFFTQCRLYEAPGTPGVVAPPGFSEHELGLAVDADTTSHEWLRAHAHEYGFMLSYPAGLEACTGYPAEEWHWRYLGAAAAADARARGLSAHEYLSGVRCDGSPAG